MRNFFISLGEVYNDRVGMTRMMLIPALFMIIISADFKFYFTCLFLSFIFSVAIKMSELKQNHIENQETSEQTIEPGIDEESNPNNNAQDSERNEN